MSSFSSQNEKDVKAASASVFDTAAQPGEVHIDFMPKHGIKPDDIGCAFESFTAYVAKIYGMGGSLSLETNYKEVSPAANAARLTNRANYISGIKTVNADAISVGDANINRDKYLTEMWAYLEKNHFYYVSLTELRPDSACGREPRKQAMDAAAKELTGTWVRFRVDGGYLIPWVCLTFDNRNALSSCVSIPFAQALELREIVDDAVIPTVQEKQIFRITGLSPSGEIIATPQVLDQRQRVACAEMFPYLRDVFPNGNLSEFIDEYMNSKENLLIVRGIHGSGKTTLTRTMSTHVDLPVYYCTNVKVAASPNFFTGLEMLAQKHKNRLLVIFEECDALLQPKAPGEASLVSELLTSSDGLVESGLKLVFVSNITNMSNIDENLLRNGRLFYQFVTRTLTNAQARALRSAVGKGELENDAPELTVGDALSEKRAALRLVDTRPGFRS